MPIADAQRGERAFTITWTDRSATEIPFVWLRDNDPDEFHPQTRERVFDLTSVDINISPESFEMRSDELIVKWPERSKPSVYLAGWLHSHRPGQVRHDPSRVDQSLWNRKSLPELPRVDA